MKTTDWKNTITSICGLVILITGSLVTAIQIGVITFLPLWTSGVCVLLGVIATSLIAWATGKNPNLTPKTARQIDNLNNEQESTKNSK